MTYPNSTVLSDSVLVVDDDSDAREMLSEYLVFRGFVVHRAQDGGEARLRSPSACARAWSSWIWQHVKIRIRAAHARSELRLEG